MRTRLGWPLLPWIVTTVDNCEVCLRSARLKSTTRSAGCDFIQLSGFFNDEAWHPRRLIKRWRSHPFMSLHKWRKAHCATLCNVKRTSEKGLPLWLYVYVTKPLVYTQKQYALCLAFCRRVFHMEVVSVMQCQRTFRERLALKHRCCSFFCPCILEDGGFRRNGQTLSSAPNCAAYIVFSNAPIVRSTDEKGT